MSFRVLSRSLAQPLRGLATRTTWMKRMHRLQIDLSSSRRLSTTPARWDQSFTNILADENPPPVQVSSITDEGIQLADGLLLPSSCIFLEGQVLLWDVPQKLWEGWGPERFEVFETTLPRPEILILGTGRGLIQPPPSIRSYLNTLGIQLDVMSTRNACSTYNILAEEGRRVAAALLPLTPQAWHKVHISQPSN